MLPQIHPLRGASKSSNIQTLKRVCDVNLPNNSRHYSSLSSRTTKGPSSASLSTRLHGLSRVPDVYYYKVEEVNSDVVGVMSRDFSTTNDYDFHEEQQLRAKVVILAGGTAVGKTSTAIEMAKSLNGEIISADSVQIYQGFDIGSAKVKIDELDDIPHHMIDSCGFGSPDFNASQFYMAAMNLVKDIIARGRIPIIVGGTGMYIRWLMYGKPEEMSNTYDPIILNTIKHLYMGNFNDYKRLSTIDNQCKVRSDDNFNSPSTVSSSKSKASVKLNDISVEETVQVSNTTLNMIIEEINTKCKDAHHISRQTPFFLPKDLVSNIDFYDRDSDFLQFTLKNMILDEVFSLNNNIYNFAVAEDTTVMVDGVKVETDPFYSSKNTQSSIGHILLHNYNLPTKSIDDNTNSTSSTETQTYETLNLPKVSQFKNIPNFQQMLYFCQQIQNSSDPSINYFDIINNNTPLTNSTITHKSPMFVKNGYSLPHPSLASPNKVKTMVATTSLLSSYMYRIYCDSLLKNILSVYSKETKDHPSSKLQVLLHAYNNIVNFLHPVNTSFSLESLFDLSNILPTFIFDAYQLYDITLYDNSNECNHTISSLSQLSFKNLLSLVQSHPVNDIDLEKIVKILHSFSIQMNTLSNTQILNQLNHQDNSDLPDLKLTVDEDVTVVYDEFYNALSAPHSLHNILFPYTNDPQQLDITPYQTILSSFVSQCDDSSNATTSDTPFEISKNVNIGRFMSSTVTDLNEKTVTSVVDSTKIDGIIVIPSSKTDNESNNYITSQNKKSYLVTDSTTLINSPSLSNPSHSGTLRYIQKRSLPPTQVDPLTNIIFHSKLLNSSYSLELLAWIDYQRSKNDLYRLEKSFIHALSRSLLDSNTSMEKSNPYTIVGDNFDKTPCVFAPATPTPYKDRMEHSSNDLSLHDIEPSSNQDPIAALKLGKGPLPLPKSPLLLSLPHMGRGLIHDYDVRYFFLTTDRNFHYRLADYRCEQMMRQGMLNETLLLMNMVNHSAGGWDHGKFDDTKYKVDMHDNYDNFNILRHYKDNPGVITDLNEEAQRHSVDDYVAPASRDIVSSYTTYNDNEIVETGGYDEDSGFAVFNSQHEDTPVDNTNEYESGSVVTGTPADRINKAHENNCYYYPETSPEFAQMKKLLFLSTHGFSTPLVDGKLEHNSLINVPTKNPRKCNNTIDYHNFQQSDIVPAFRHFYELINSIEEQTLHESSNSIERSYDVEFSSNMNPLDRAKVAESRRKQKEQLNNVMLSSSFHIDAVDSIGWSTKNPFNDLIQQEEIKRDMSIVDKNENSENPNVQEGSAYVSKTQVVINTKGYSQQHYSDLLLQRRNAILPYFSTAFQLVFDEYVSDITKKVMEEYLQLKQNMKLESSISHLVSTELGDHYDEAETSSNEDIYYNSIKKPKSVQTAEVLFHRFLLSSYYKKICHNHGITDRNIKTEKYDKSYGFFNYVAVSRNGLINPTAANYAIAATAQLSAQFNMNFSAAHVDDQIQLLSSLTEVPLTFCPSVTIDVGNSDHINKLLSLISYYYHNPTFDLDRSDLNNIIAASLPIKNIFHAMHTTHVNNENVYASYENLYSSNPNALLALNWLERTLVLRGCNLVNTKGDILVHDDLLAGPNQYGFYNSTPVTEQYKGGWGASSRLNVLCEDIRNTQVVDNNIAMNMLPVIISDVSKYIFTELVSRRVEHLEYLDYYSVFSPDLKASLKLNVDSEIDIALTGDTAALYVVGNPTNHTNIAISTTRKFLRMFLERSGYGYFDAYTRSFIDKSILDHEKKHGSKITDSESVENQEVDDHLEVPEDSKIVSQYSSDSVVADDGVVDAEELDILSKYYDNTVTKDNELLNEYYDENQVATDKSTEQDVDELDKDEVVVDQVVDNEVIEEKPVDVLDVSDRDELARNKDVIPSFSSDKVLKSIAKVPKERIPEIIEELKEKCRMLERNQSLITNTDNFNLPFDIILYLDDASLVPVRLGGYGKYVISSANNINAQHGDLYTSIFDLRESPHRNIISSAIQRDVPTTEIHRDNLYQYMSKNHTAVNLSDEFDFGQVQNPTDELFSTPSAELDRLKLNELSIYHKMEVPNRSVYPLEYAMSRSAVNRFAFNKEGIEINEPAQYSKFHSKRALQKLITNDLNDDDYGNFYRKSLLDSWNNRASPVEIGSSYSLVDVLLSHKYKQRNNPNDYVYRTDQDSSQLGFAYKMMNRHHEYGYLDLFFRRALKLNYLKNTNYIRDEQLVDDSLSMGLGRRVQERAQSSFNYDSIYLNDQPDQSSLDNHDNLDNINDDISDSEFPMFSQDQDDFIKDIFMNHEDDDIAYSHTTSSFTRHLSELTQIPLPKSSSPSLIADSHTNEGNNTSTYDPVKARKLRPRFTSSDISDRVKAVKMHYYSRVMIDKGYSARVPYSPLFIDPVETHSMLLERDSQRLIKRREALKKTLRDEAGYIGVRNNYWIDFYQQSVAEAKKTTRHIPSGSNLFSTLPIFSTSPNSIPSNLQMYSNFNFYSNGRMKRKDQLDDYMSDYFMRRIPSNATHMDGISNILKYYVHRFNIKNSEENDLTDLTQNKGVVDWVHTSYNPEHTKNNLFTELQGPPSIIDETIFKQTDATSIYNSIPRANQLFKDATKPIKEMYSIPSMPRTNSKILSDGYYLSNESIYKQPITRTNPSSLVDVLPFPLYSPTPLPLSVTERNHDFLNYNFKYRPYSMPYTSGSLNHNFFAQNIVIPQRHATIFPVFNIANHYNSGNHHYLNPQYQSQVGSEGYKSSDNLLSPYTSSVHPEFSAFTTLMSPVLLTKPSHRSALPPHSSRTRSIGYESAIDFINDIDMYKLVNEYKDMVDTATLPDFRGVEMRLNYDHTADLPRDPFNSSDLSHSLYSYNILNSDIDHPVNSHHDFPSTSYNTEASTVPSMIDTLRKETPPTVVIRSNSHLDPTNNHNAIYNIGDHTISLLPYYFGHYQHGKMLSDEIPEPSSTTMPSFDAMGVIQYVPDSVSPLHKTYANSKIVEPKCDARSKRQLLVTNVANNVCKSTVLHYPIENSVVVDGNQRPYVVKDYDVIGGIEPEDVRLAGTSLIFNNTSRPSVLMNTSTIPNRTIDLDDPYKTIALTLEAHKKLVPATNKIDDNAVQNYNHTGDPAKNTFNPLTDKQTFYNPVRPTVKLTKTMAKSNVETSMKKKVTFSPSPSTSTSTSAIVDDGYDIPCAFNQIVKSHTNDVNDQDNMDVNNSKLTSDNSQFQNIDLNNSEYQNTFANINEKFENDVIGAIPSVNDDNSFLTSGDRFTRESRLLNRKKLLHERLSNITDHTNATIKMQYQAYEINPISYRYIDPTLISRPGPFPILNSRSTVSKHGPDELLHKMDILLNICSDAKSYDLYNSRIQNDSFNTTHYVDRSFDNVVRTSKEHKRRMKTILRKWTRSIFDCKSQLPIGSYFLLHRDMSRLSGLSKDIIDDFYVDPWFSFIFNNHNVLLPFSGKEGFSSNLPSIVGGLGSNEDMLFRNIYEKNEKMYLSRNHFSRLRPKYLPFKPVVLRHLDGIDSNTVPPQRISDILKSTALNHPIAPSHFMQMPSNPRQYQVFDATPITQANDANIALNYLSPRIVNHHLNQAKQSKGDLNNINSNYIPFNNFSDVVTDFNSNRLHINSTIPFVTSILTYTNPMYDINKTHSNMINTYISEDRLENNNNLYPSVVESGSSDDIIPTLDSPVKNNSTNDSLDLLIKNSVSSLHSAPVNTDKIGNVSVNSVDNDKDVNDNTNDNTKVVSSDSELMTPYTYIRESYSYPPVHDPRVLPYHHLQTRLSFDEEQQIIADSLVGEYNDSQLIIDNESVYSHGQDYLNLIELRNMTRVLLGESKDNVTKVLGALEDGNVDDLMHLYRQSPAYNQLVTRGLDVQVIEGNVKSMFLDLLKKNVDPVRSVGVSVKRYGNLDAIRKTMHHIEVAGSKSGGSGGNVVETLKRVGAEYVKLPYLQLHQFTSEDSVDTTDAYKTYLRKTFTDEYASYSHSGEGIITGIYKNHGKDIGNFIFKSDGDKLTQLPDLTTSVTADTHSTSAPSLPTSLLNSSLVNFYRSLNLRILSQISRVDDEKIRNIGSQHSDINYPCMFKPGGKSSHIQRSTYPTILPMQGVFTCIEKDSPHVYNTRSAYPKPAHNGKDNNLYSSLTFSPEEVKSKIRVQNPNLTLPLSPLLVGPIFKKFNIVSLHRDAQMKNRYFYSNFERFGYAPPLPIYPELDIYNKQNAIERNTDGDVTVNTETLGLNTSTRLTIGDISTNVHDEHVDTTVTMLNESNQNMKFISPDVVVGEIVPKYEVNELFKSMVTDDTGDVFLNGNNNGRYVGLRDYKSLLFDASSIHHPKPLNLSDPEDPTYPNVLSHPTDTHMVSTRYHRKIQRSNLLYKHITHYASKLPKNMLDKDVLTKDSEQKNQAIEGYKRFMNTIKYNNPVYVPSKGYLNEVTGASLNSTFSEKDTVLLKTYTSLSKYNRIPVLVKKAQLQRLLPKKLIDQFLKRLENIQTQTRNYIKTQFMFHKNDPLCMYIHVNTSTVPTLMKDNDVDLLLSRVVSHNERELASSRESSLTTLEHDDIVTYSKQIVDHCGDVSNMYRDIYGFNTPLTSNITNLKNVNVSSGDSVTGPNSDNVDLDSTDAYTIMEHNRMNTIYNKVNSQLLHLSKQNFERVTTATDDWSKVHKDNFIGVYPVLSKNTMFNNYDKENLSSTNALAMSIGGVHNAKTPPQPVEIEAFSDTLHDLNYHVPYIVNHDTKTSKPKTNPKYCKLFDNEDFKYTSHLNELLNYSKILYPRSTFKKRPVKKHGKKTIAKSHTKTHDDDDDEDDLLSANVGMVSGRILRRYFMTNDPVASDNVRMTRNVKDARDELSVSKTSIRRAEQSLIFAQEGFDIDKFAPSVKPHIKFVIKDGEESDSDGGDLVVTPSLLSHRIRSMNRKYRKTKKYNVHAFHFNNNLDPVVDETTEDVSEPIQPSQTTQATQTTQPIQPTQTTQPIQPIHKPYIAKKPYTNQSHSNTSKNDKNKLNAKNRDDIVSSHTTHSTSPGSKPLSPEAPFTIRKSRSSNNYSPVDSILKSINVNPFKPLSSLASHYFNLTKNHIVSSQDISNVKKYHDNPAKGIHRVDHLTNYVYELIHRRAWLMSAWASESSPSVENTTVNYFSTTGKDLKVYLSENSYWLKRIIFKNNQVLLHNDFVDDFLDLKNVNWTPVDNNLECKYKNIVITKNSFGDIILNWDLVDIIFHRNEIDNAIDHISKNMRSSTDETSTQSHIDEFANTPAFQDWLLNKDDFKSLETPSSESSSLVKHDLVVSSGMSVIENLNRFPPSTSSPTHNPFADELEQSLSTIHKMQSYHEWIAPKFNPDTRTVDPNNVITPPTTHQHSQFQHLLKNRSGIPLTYDFHKPHPIFNTNVDGKSNSNVLRAETTETNEINDSEVEIDSATHMDQVINDVLNFVPKPYSALQDQKKTKPSVLPEPYNNICVWDARYRDTYYQSHMSVMDALTSNDPTLNKSEEGTVDEKSEKSEKPHDLPYSHTSDGRNAIDQYKEQLKNTASSLIDLVSLSQKQYWEWKENEQHLQYEQDVKELDDEADFNTYNPINQIYTHDGPVAETILQFLDYASHMNTRDITYNLEKKEIKEEDCLFQSADVLRNWKPVHKKYVLTKHKY